MQAEEIVQTDEISGIVAMDHVNAHRILALSHRIGQTHGHHDMAYADVDLLPEHLLLFQDVFS